MEYSQMNTKNDQQALSGAGQTAPRRKSLSEKAGYQNRGTGKNPVTAAEGQEVPKYRKEAFPKRQIWLLNITRYQEVPALRRNNGESYYGE